MWALNAAFAVELGKLEVDPVSGQHRCAKLAQRRDGLGQ
jgi:hypothetical protein